MKFISTKDMTNENAPEGKVLVQYLQAVWGGYSVEFTTGYYDNPNDYENIDNGEGVDFIKPSDVYFDSVTSQLFVPDKDLNAVLLVNPSTGDRAILSL